MRIYISEIREIKERLKEINSYEFDSIEWLLDDGSVYQVSQEIKDEFVISCLSNKDFVDFLPRDLNRAKNKASKKFRVISGTHMNSEFEILGMFSDIHGKSWRESETHEAIAYVMRIMRDGLPYDDDVYFGRIKNRTVLIHKTEIMEETADSMINSQTPS